MAEQRGKFNKLFSLSLTTRSTSTRKLWNEETTPSLIINFTYILIKAIFFMLNLQEKEIDVENDQNVWLLLSAALIDQFF